MNKKNNIQFNTFDYILIAICALLLIISWLYVLINYAYLPEIIAIHFNGSGEPDGFGKKTTIWLAPIIFTSLSVGFIFAAKNPKLLDISNKIKTIKDEIAQSKTLLFTSILLSSILCFIVFSMINTSIHPSDTAHWILPTILTITGVYLIIVIYYFITSKKK